MLRSTARRLGSAILDGFSALISIQVSIRLWSASFGTISHLVPAVRQSVHDAARRLDPLKHADLIASNLGISREGGGRRAQPAAGWFCFVSAPPSTKLPRTAAAILQLDFISISSLKCVRWDRGARCPIGRFALAASSGAEIGHSKVGVSCSS
jgi:hypothetical protein